VDRHRKIAGHKYAIRARPYGAVLGVQRSWTGSAWKRGQGTCRWSSMVAHYGVQTIGPQRCVPNRAPPHESRGIGHKAERGKDFAILVQRSWTGIARRRGQGSCRWSSMVAHYGVQTIGPQRCIPNRAPPHESQGIGHKAEGGTTVTDWHRKVAGARISCHFGTTVVDRHRAEAGTRILSLDLNGGTLRCADHWSSEVHTQQGATS
jgi:hypothetical protein